MRASSSIDHSHATFNKTILSCHFNLKNAWARSIVPPDESMEVLFGDIRVSLPLAARRARARRREKAHIWFRDVSPTNLEGCQSLPNFCNRICKCADGLKGSEVEIILEFNSQRRNECELSRLAPSVSVLLLLPSFKLTKASPFSATFTVSIYCWLLNHFIPSPSGYVVLFTARPLS